jgi:PleD family two-component response regulator
MHQPIRQSLAGRRFALIGFDLLEGDSIIAALATVHGIGRVIGAESNIPGLHPLSHFDACFINASAEGVSEQPSPIEMIAHSRKPAIIVGSFDALMTRFAAVADLNREFILRPCSPEDFIFRAYRVLRFAESADVAIRLSARSSARRVVLADDDDTTILMISTILKHFHFECEIARDGAEALEIARRKRPDLVLLDVAMPHMNGFETLTALRGDIATRSTPIILVSAHRDEAEVIKAFSLGADDYVTKPFNSGELMARINRVLHEPEEN